MNQHKKVEKALHQTFEQITTGAKLLMNHTSQYQDIKTYVNKRLSEIEFSEEQQSKIDRYNFICNQISGGKYSKPELINTIQNLFKISKHQAYADYKAAQQLFFVNAFNKKIEIQIQLESAKCMLHEAMKTNDFETALQLHENIIALLKMIPEEKEQQGNEFESITIEASFNPALLGGNEIDMQEVLTLINTNRNKKITTDLFEKLPSKASCSQ